MLVVRPAITVAPEHLGQAHQVQGQALPIDISPRIAAAIAPAAQAPATAATMDRITTVMDMDQVTVTERDTVTAAATVVIGPAMATAVDTDMAAAMDTVSPGMA